MRRQYKVFGDARFERLAGLSNSHLCRLRRSTTYWRRRLQVVEPRPAQVSFGEHRNLTPPVVPVFWARIRFIRATWDGEKDLHEINLVDEVMQYQFVAAVDDVSERFLVPALKGSIVAFPFIV